MAAAKNQMNTQKNAPKGSLKPLSAVLLALGALLVIAGAVLLILSTNKNRVYVSAQVSNIQMMEDNTSAIVSPEVEIVTFGYTAEGSFRTFQLRGNKNGYAVGNRVSAYYINGNPDKLYIGEPTFAVSFVPLILGALCAAAGAIVYAKQKKK